MTSGVYERTTEHNIANSKSKKDVPKSPEHCANMSVSHTGVPNSPEHNAAISEGMKNSDAIKSNADEMRGGNDLINHHYIYDESDLSKYTMKMTRSQHSRLHLLMRRSGIKVPHINVKGE